MPCSTGKKQGSSFTEILAIRFGLQLASERGLNRLIVESDSLVAINLINMGDSIMRERGRLVLDIGYCLQL